MPKPADHVHCGVLQPEFSSNFIFIKIENTCKINKENVVMWIEIRTQWFMKYALFWHVFFPSLEWLSWACPKVTCANLTDTSQHYLVFILSMSQLDCSSKTINRVLKIINQKRFKKKSTILLGDWDNMDCRWGGYYD